MPPGPHYSVKVVKSAQLSCGVQDRDQGGKRTPRWRGVTLLHELRAQGIPVAIASDNTRDQFFAYGDLDMLEVFNQVICAADAAHSASVTSFAWKDVSTRHLVFHPSFSCSDLSRYILHAGTSFCVLLYL